MNIVWAAGPSIASMPDTSEAPGTLTHRPADPSGATPIEPHSPVKPFGTDNRPFNESFLGVMPRRKGPGDVPASKRLRDTLKGLLAPKTRSLPTLGLR